MALVTVRKASELTGKSIPTLYRHIKQGKLSRRSDDLIDTAELIRAYGELRLNETSVKTQVVSNDNHDIAWYRAQVDLLQAQLIAQREEFIDRERRLMVLLEHIPEKSKKAKKSKKSLLNKIADLIDRS